MKKFTLFFVLCLMSALFADGPSYHEPAVSFTRGQSQILNFYIDQDGTSPHYRNFNYEMFNNLGLNVERIASGDIDGDGSDEYVVASGNVLKVFSSSGTLITSENVYYDIIDVTVGNFLDNCEGNELAVLVKYNEYSTNDFRIFVFGVDSYNNTLYHHTDFLFSLFEISPYTELLRLTSGDFNNDGIDDFAFTSRVADYSGSTPSYSWYYVRTAEVYDDWNPYGMRLRQVSAPYWTDWTTANGRMLSDITSGDYNGDGYDDIAYIFGDYYNYSNDKVIIKKSRNNGTSFSTLGEINSSQASFTELFALANTDIDGDNKNEVAVVQTISGSTHPGRIRFYEYNSNGEFENFYKEVGFTLTSSNTYDITGMKYAPFSPLKAPTGNEEILPTTNTLHQNYPNPFNPETTIKFDLANDGMVSLNVFNAKGEVVKSFQKNMTAGTHTYNFDASNLISGTYFYQIKTKDFTATKKMLLMK